jgi:hypothetical protein
MSKYLAKDTEIEFLIISGRTLETERKVQQSMDQHD